MVFKIVSNKDVNGNDNAKQTKAEKVAAGAEELGTSSIEIKLEG